MLVYSGVDSPCITRVKGEGAKLNLKEMPYRLNSLNEGDAFVIDFGYCLYQWDGKQSSYEEQKFASKLATKILQERNMSQEKFIRVTSDTSAPVTLRESIFRKVSAPDNVFRSSRSLRSLGQRKPSGESCNGADAGSVVTVHTGASSSTLDETDSVSEEQERAKEAMLFELLPDRKASFFGLVQKQLSLKTARRGGKDGKQKLRKKKLFHVRFEPSGVRFVLLNKDKKLQHPDALLTKSAFNMQDQFLLDTGLEIYVWVGSWCNSALAPGIGALYKQKYFSKSKRPMNLPVTIVPDGKERKYPDFLQNFQQLKPKKSYQL